MREFESIRDFMTSATLATLSDLPFCLLFLVIIWMIGGALAWVPLMAVPIILIVSLIIQLPLRRCMQENMREDIAENMACWLRPFSGIEALKAARGEGAMQKRWEEYSALSAHTSMKNALFIQYDAELHDSNTAAYYGCYRCLWCLHDPQW